MKVILLLLLSTVVCPLAFAARVDIPGYDETNEGTEFYVGFFRNRFGRTSEQEDIDPVVCIMTRDTRRTRVDVSSIRGRIQRISLDTPGEVECVNIPIGFVVFDSTEESAEDSLFKGIHIRALQGRRIAVFGQNEEVASNDGYVALPIISRPAGLSYEYIGASVYGDQGTVGEAKDSVILIVGTENDTQIIVEPPPASQLAGGIEHALAPNGRFFNNPTFTNTVIIQRFQTFYLQVRGNDISGTRIIANKPVSVFSGHECANIPLTSQPCDVLIEQVPPVDTWGTEVVTIPLITRSADTIKVFASQASTTVSVTRTDISSGIVTRDPSFTLGRNGFRELVISDYTMIQANNSIGVFQFSRSYTTDNVLDSDPFMLWVPSCEQYRDSYVVAPLPFDPSIEDTVDGRVAYANYTNIAVPVEYFNASMITVNNNPIDASDFSAIRRSDNSIWGYGAQLTLDVGAQVIQHQDSDAALSVTMYGFSNQQSWGCAGGTRVVPLTIAVMQCSDVTVIESDGNAIVQCTRSGATFSSVSFSVTTVDGTATAGNDYTSIVTQEFTFGPGESSVSIPIPIIDDSVPENQETFTLEIVDNPTIVPPDNNPVVTVIDDDRVTIEFSAPLYTTMESTGFLQATLVSSLPLTSDYQVRVRFPSGGGTSATRNVDFEASTMRITIPAGETIVNFSVPVTVDGTFETTETFNMRLDTLSSAENLGVEVGTLTNVIGQITDAATVMFSETTYSVNEKDGSAQIGLVISNPPSTDTTVQVTNIDGSATGGGVDYDSGPYTATFLAGQTTATFEVPITDDGTFEGNETFMLTIDSSSLPTGLTTGDPDQATVTIFEEDITVMFSETTYSVNEGDGSVQIGLVLSNPSSTATTVRVTNTDGSATGGGVDYTSGPYTVTIPAGQTTATFNIPINNDMILESDEDFKLNIDESSLPGSVRLGTPDEATVIIMDNDRITVMFSETTYSVNEGDGSAQIGLVLSGPSSTATTVEVFNTDGSATGGGVDYDSGPYTVIIPAGDTTATFNISINDDMIFERDENFMLTINGTSLPDVVAPGNPDEATVTIVDDDPVTVMFSQSTYSVNENAGPVQIGLVLSGRSSTPITVEVFTTNRSATGGGVDYTSGPYTVTFPAGQTTATFNVPITDDTILEGDENFMLTIDETSLPDDVTRGTPGEATVTIVDNDDLTVTFSQTTYTGLEQSGVVSVTLLLEGGTSSSDIGVTVTPSDQTPVSAQGNGVDYTSTPITATFPAGATRVTVDVPVTVDNIAEQRETFDLSFTIPSSLSGQVSPGRITEAVGAILDDTPITVMFTETTYSVNEGDGSVRIGVELSGPSSTATTVEVFNTNRTAIGGGVDYTSGPYTVTIPAGQTTATFNVPITDDTILEGDENFMLTIDGTSLPDGVAPGNPDEATVTIVDNDPITVMFSQTTYNVNENAGPARPVLVLSNPSATVITVRVREVGGSATGGVDYDSGPYTVTFPIGVTMVPFDVPITDDMILEGNEDFDLIIVPGSLPNGVSRGNPNRASVTIVDNDEVTVRFEDATETVSEGDGTVTITIIKEGDADIPVMVTVTTSDGTATAGSDYGPDGDPNPPVFTPITIPAGVSSVDIGVQIIDDDCREVDETFNADLTVLPNQDVNLGSPDRTVITIEDDDESTVQFVNAPYIVGEGSGAYNVCLSITPACDRRAEVDLVTEPKDALPNEDYFPVTRTVSFAPNQMVSCVQLNNVISDNIRETDECFTLVIDPPPGSDLVPGGNANVTIVDNTVIASPGMFNDTVIGDPLYEVPLNTISNSTFPVTTSLCYEIHGEAGKIFNLVSDGCVQVNANYSAMDIPDNGNIISQIGVFAYDTAGGCINILVDVNDCIPVVNGVAYSGDPGYNTNGVTARRRNGRARISVPNCATALFDNLVFWVTCQDIEGQKMIKFQVVRGNQLIPDSHGLLGQFWNIPVSADIFTGNLTTDRPVSPYVVTVDHPDDPRRQFVAELFERTWDKSRRPCLYAGDGQGGSILDPVTPNDPVIAGTFRDYEVSDLFADDFIYNKLEERICP